ncbi:hypothetical protein A2W14_00095, partial [Candidatus Gottesmanbacteria bacterium RBG_16_37_8]
YGYPILIAPLYFIFGKDATTPWKIMQSVMDSTTGFLVYIIALKIFRKRNVAFAAFLIYLFNPYTASYSGVLLTEVASIFFSTLALFLLLLFLEKPSPLIMAATIFLFSFLTQIRPGFFYSAIIAGVFLTAYMNNKLKLIREKLLIYLIGLTALCLPFIYNIAGNLVYYKQFSIMTVDNFFIQQLYLSLYVDRWPVHPTQNSNYPWQVGQIYGEFSFVPKNALERKAMVEKYKKLAMEEIKNNPGNYLVRSLRKMWYIWDKRALFYYAEPENKLMTAVLFWTNRIILFFSFIGLVLFGVKNRINKTPSVFSIIIFLFALYLTLVHILSVSEDRFSLPAYPFVFMYLAYFFWIIGQKFADLKKK